AQQVVVVRRPFDDRRRGVFEAGGFVDDDRRVSPGRAARAGWLPGAPPGRALLPRFLALVAARARAGPPVTTSRGMSRWLKIASADSSVGGTMIVTRGSMPKRAAIALLYSRTAWAAQFAPLGCGLATFALPDATMLITL